MKTVKILFVVLMGVALINSCTKEILPNPNPKTMDDLVIKATFDWKTVADYKFTIQGTVSRVITIASVSGTEYKKSFLTANQPYTVNLSIPTYEKSVNLKYNGQVVLITLSSSSITYSFK